VTEPLRIKVTRWLCPHCHRGHALRSTALAHMERCWDIPGNRACRTCNHGSPEHCRVGVVIPADHLIIHCALWEPDEDDGGQP
jgi:hypothetical protein